MPAFKDLMGQRFGKWTVLQRSVTRLHPKRVYWDCKCDCGKEIAVSSGSLSQGKSVSCGYPCCYGAKGEQGLRTAVRTYIKQAKARGYSWELSETETRTLLLGNCAYCEQKPNKHFGRRSNYSDVTNEYHAIKINGIDRVDNLVGYVPGNCVSCCSMCNYAKHYHSLDTFKDWVSRVHAVLNTSAKSEAG